MQYIAVSKSKRDTLLHPFRHQHANAIAVRNHVANGVCQPSPAANRDAQRITILYSDGDFNCSALRNQHGHGDADGNRDSDPHANGIAVPLRHTVPDTIG